MGNFDDGSDKDYMPKTKDDISLGPEDFVVPINPSEQARFQRQLIATVRRLKKKQQELYTHENELNDKWMKILVLEVDLETRRVAPKSFPKRQLLPDLDDEAADKAPLAHCHEGQPDRPHGG